MYFLTLVHQKKIMATTGKEQKARLGKLVARMGQLVPS